MTTLGTVLETINQIVSKFKKTSDNPVGMTHSSSSLNILFSPRRDEGL